MVITITVKCAINFINNDLTNDFREHSWSVDNIITINITIKYDIFLETQFKYV